MSARERQEHLQKITKRLVSFTAAVLMAFAIGLYGILDWIGGKDHSYLVLMVFAAGLLGGFVSIQQRLPDISLDELKVLSASWISITLIPINGGVFAIVLMLMFAGKIIQGQLFPIYPEGEAFAITNSGTFFEWMTKAYPINGVEAAKLLFWSFVAGFSERFVPQIIRRTAEEVEKPEEKPPEDSNNKS